MGLHTLEDGTLISELALMKREVGTGRVTREEFNEIIELAKCIQSQRDIAIKELHTLIRIAKKEEGERLLKGIQSLIKEGELQGNGIDETAERNGLILAFNYLVDHKT